MEQKSNVQYRAEKEYKNSREKFFLLLREIISNAIHAVLIRKNKESDFRPKLNFDIEFDESSERCILKLTDNGEGFTDANRNYFEELDKKNIEKEQFNFHPLGQGRLAIVYFADSAEYETVYKNKDGVLKKRRIPYPDTSSTLFLFDQFQEDNSEEKDSFTTLRINITKQQSFGRAKTFFSKYSDVTSLKQWFAETFFPFIVNNADLEITINFNGVQGIIRKDTLEDETSTLSFELLLQGEDEVSDQAKVPFKLWLIKNPEKIQREKKIVCFARNLQANLSNGKLSYSLDSNDGYIFYLTSDYFDENVDTKGEKIEISEDIVSQINSKINEVLDNKFKTVIERNRATTKQNLVAFKKQYPSLESFIDNIDFSKEKNVVKKEEIVDNAIEEKGKIEKKFWNRTDNEISDPNYYIKYQKLLNSSLHIYVEHRREVLKRLHDLIQTFDPDGNDKPELEKTVHELFLRRGTTLKDSNDINHLHNLWILDDKFTIFSNDFRAKSTNPGQPLSDIYIWADDPEKTKQILILELKSTTKAHNAGDRKEGMVAQVKRYAQDFYHNPKNALNWDVETSKVQYIGVILARKSDIIIEMSSNNVSGDFEPIPFLANSYYKDERFSIDDKNPKLKMPIRIELYSFEDIYDLAFSRNQVFFKLLQKEFEVVENAQLIENEKSTEPMQ